MGITCKRVVRGKLGTDRYRATAHPHPTEPWLKEGAALRLDECGPGGPTVTLAWTGALFWQSLLKPPVPHGT